MSGERILIIDDSHEIVKHLSERVLSPHGYVTEHALDGQTGLEKIRAVQPDLVMLDYNLPEMSGLDVLHSMAQESLSVPVVLMTGYGSELSAIEAFRLGAKDYLIKPFTQDEVLEAIDRALVERRLQHDKADLAEQLRRVKAEASQQVHELKHLTKLAKRITVPLDKDEFLERVLDGALALALAQESALWLPNAQQTELTIFHRQADSGAVGSESVAVDMLDALGSPVVEVLRTGQPVRQAVFADEGVCAGPGRYAHAVLFVPVQLRGATMGVLSVTNGPLLRAFSRKDEYLLSSLADYTAIALQNARALQTLDATRIERPGSKNAAGAATPLLAEMGDAQTTVQQVAQWVYADWQVEAVVLWKRNAQQLQVLAQAGTAVSGLTNLSLPVGTGFVGQVVASGVGQYVNDVNGNGRFHQFPNAPSGFHIRSTLCMPLAVQGETIGAMHLVNKQDGYFTDRDLERAGQWAATVALILTHPLIASDSHSRTHIRDDFIATVSHDMRAPLNTISGFASVLADVGPLNSEQDLYVQHIQRATDRMLATINDLLDLARTRTELREEDYRACDMCDIVRAVVDEWSSHALSRRVRLELILPEVGDCTITGSAEQIQRAIGNLIDNAIKYSAPDQTVEIQLNVGESDLLLSVRDAGVGIRSDDLPHIFERFYRGQGGDAQHGTGLGLALVQSVAEAHGGSVWAESNAGAGSTFVLRLPLLRLHGGVSPN